MKSSSSNSFGLSTIFDNSENVQVEEESSSSSIPSRIHSTLQSKPRRESLDRLRSLPMGMERRGLAWIEFAQKHCSLNFYPASLIIDHDGIDDERIVDYVIEYNKCSVVAMEQIDRDLPRTFPDVVYFANTDVREALGRILQAIAIEYPSVGYVQGMNFLVANIMLHMDGNESKTFYLFRMMMESPMYELRHIFDHGLPNVKTLSLILDWLLFTRHPTLQRHFDRIGLEPLFYSQTWIMTLFTYMVPFSELSFIWDSFFEHGWVAIFRYALALFEMFFDELHRGDFEKCTYVLRQAAERPQSDWKNRSDEIIISDAEYVIIQKAIALEPIQLPQSYQNDFYRTPTKSKRKSFGTASPATIFTEGTASTSNSPMNFNNEYVYIDTENENVERVSAYKLAYG